MAPVSQLRTNFALVERIISTRGMACVLHAPGGFGKSQLLVNIRRTLLEQGASYSGTVADALAEAEFPWLLLDDDDAATLDVRTIRLALDRSQQSGTGIVIATRQIRQLPLARLQAEGRVLRFGPHQIGIAHDDAVATLRSVVDKKMADRLADMANGWSVAIRLLHDYAHDPSARFDDDGEFVMHSGLAAYFDQEILPDLPNDWIAALRFACIVDSCNPAMLDFIRPNDDLGRHLAPLREHLPGLADHRDGCLAINRLLRLHLLRQFEQLPQAERADALERASQFCARAGRVAEAANLVTRVGSPSAVVDFVRRSDGLRLWVTAGYEVIREIVTQAGMRGVQDEPRLKLLKCVVLMKTGEVEEAEQLLAEVSPRLGTDKQAQTDVAIVRMTLNFYGCRAISDEDVTAFRKSLPRGGDHPSWNGMLLQMRALLEVQRGNLDEAKGVLLEGMRIARDPRAGGYGEIFLGIHSTNVALAQGDIQLARRTLAQARKIWRERSPGDTDVETVMDVLTAALEFEAGRLSSTRLHIKRAMHRMPHVEAWLDIYFAAYETIARLLANDMGLSSTLANLKAQQDALIISGLPRIARLVNAIEICLTGEAALLGEAVNLPIEAVEVDEPESSQSWQERELFAMVNGYAGLCANRPDATVTAMEKLLHFAMPRGLHRSVLRARLMLVAAHNMRRDDEMADRIFEEALTLGSSTGMSRAFAEIGGKAVQQRCRQRIARLDGGAHMDPGMLQLLRAVARWQDVRPSESIARFTPREIDVLRALNHGGADKTIGRRLGITDHGVRYHLKNIYRKLGVSDRVGAMAQAREVGLLK